MLERMRDFSKSWIMKILLGLVALSFLAYFGYSPFQKAQQEKLTGAFWVNEEKISTQEFFLAYNRQRERLEQQQGWPLEETQQREVAQGVLDALIDQALQEQWLREMKLWSTDDEVQAEILNLWQQVAPGHPLTPANYQAVLARFGYRSAQAFEDGVRKQLTLQKLANIQAQRVKVPESHLRQVYAESRRQVKVRAAAFTPEAYFDSVEVSPQRLKAFYRENQEKYRQPERVRVDYLRLQPERLVNEVSVVEARLEQFFNQNRDNYKISSKVSADYIRFNPAQYADQIAPTEEEIQQYFQDNAEGFLQPERIKVKYLPIAVRDPDGLHAPSQRWLQRTYAGMGRELAELEASQIFLPFDTLAEEEDPVLEKMKSLAVEIEEGLSFGDAARQYSQDPTAQQGGGLGFVRRGQLPQRLEKSLFALGVGEVSAPVRGDTGWYLFKVTNEHVPPLEEVREKVARRYAEQRLEEIRPLLQDEPIPDRLPNGMMVQQTDFFDPAQPPEELFGPDSAVFARAAARLRNGQLSNVVYGLRNYYLIYRQASEPGRPMTLEEARPQVIERIGWEKAPERARLAAEEALATMKRESLSLEGAAAEFNVTVQNTGYFAATEPPANLGSNPYAFLLAAFNLQPGQLSDVVELDSGIYLLRGLPPQPERTPELEEVRQQVEADFRRERSVELARDRAYEFLRRMDEQRLSLRKLAELDGLQVNDSGPFGKDESVPGLSDPNNRFHRAAFSIETIGEVLQDVVDIRRPSSQDVQAFYLLELKDRVPSRIPMYAEVAEPVSADLIRVVAGKKARQEGQAFVEKLKEAIASASEEINLEAFADSLKYETFETAFFTRVGFIRQIPGARNTPALIRTAFTLEPGACSDLIPVYEKTEADDGKTEPEERLTGYYVIQPIEKKEVDFEEYEEQRKTVLDQMLYARRLMSQRGWLEGMREQSNIEYNTDVLGSLGVVLEGQEPAASPAEVSDSTQESAG